MSSEYGLNGPLIVWVEQNVRNLTYLSDFSLTQISRDYCAEDCERRLRETRECTREKCYGDQEKIRLSDTKCDCPIITEFEDVPQSNSKATCLAQIVSTKAKIFHLENHHAIQKLHFKPLKLEIEGRVSFVFRDRFCVSGSGFW